MPYVDPSGVTPPGGYASYYLNNTPEAGFWHYLSQRGLVGNNPSQQYAQGQYARTMGQYMGQADANPDEGFFDYLNRTQPNFEGDFAAQSPGQRGDNSGRSLTPRARFTRAY